MKLPPSPSLSSLIIAVLLAAAGWLAISAFIVPEVPADVATSFDARAAHHAPAVLAQAGSHTGHHVPAVAAPVPVPAAASRLTRRRREPRPWPTGRSAERARSGRGRCRRTPS